MSAHQLSRTEIEQRAAGRILPKLRTDGVTPEVLDTLKRWGRILDNAGNSAVAGNDGNAVGQGAIDDAGSRTCGWGTE